MGVDNVDKSVDSSLSSISFSDLFTYIIVNLFMETLYFYTKFIMYIKWLITSLSRQTKSIFIIAFLRNLDIKILYSNVNSYYIIFLIPIIWYF